MSAAPRAMSGGSAARGGALARASAAACAYQPSEPTPATTALVQSMTAVGLTT